MTDPTYPPGSAPRGFRLRDRLEGHEGPIQSLAWSPDGKSLASGAEDSTIRIWSAEGKSLPQVLQHDRTPIRVVWSPDGQRLAGAQDDGGVWLCDVATGRSHTLRVGHAFEPEGSIGRVVAVPIDGARPPAHYTRGLRPPSSGTQLLVRSSLAWSPDGQRLAMSNDASIQIWETRTELEVLGLSGHHDRVTDLAWSPDSTKLVSASADGAPRIWDLETSSSITLNGHRAAVTSVAWSPDGRVLASGSKDRTVRLWLPDKGTENRILEGHTAEIETLCFTPDSRHLLSIGLDNVLRVWRCQTGDVAGTLGISPARMAFAFHPRLNLFALADGRDIGLWTVDWEAFATAGVETVRYTTAKIALVGDSGVGKTGIGWRLAHGEFKDHPSSHGQQFWLVPDLAASRADGTSCEAVLWDFAGQPDYRLTHALFLDDVDVALVLFDPATRQDPLKGVEYWLQQLGLRRHRPETILVGARIDRGSPTITQSEIEQYCVDSGITGGYVETSALSGHGIPELLARLKARIDWSHMVPTVTTATFKRLKEYLLRMKAGGEGDVLVAQGELRSILQREDPSHEFTDAELMTAVKHLANHGYVTILRRSSGEEAVLLAPDLLINLASSFVLEARRNPKGLGVLDEARVLRGGYDFTEVARTGQKASEALLDAVTALFLEHNVCFREALGNHTLLVFPSLINQKRPPSEDLETEEGFSYTVSGAVETVYPALVVLLGYTNTFTRTQHWQHQAQYEMDRGEVCGFRQIQEREGEIDLQLYFGVTCPPETRGLFQGLFERFLTRRDVTVVKYPPVNCPECGYRQPRSEVVRRTQAKKGFLHCGECGSRIELPRKGTEVRLSRRDRERVETERTIAEARTSLEAALVRVKSIIRDRSQSWAPPSCFISYAHGNRDHERWVASFATDLKNAAIDVLFDEDNTAIGMSIARFISQIEKADFVVAVGTIAYRLKYEELGSIAGTILAAEVDLINLRLTRAEAAKNTVLPVLLEGAPENALPPLMQGRLYCDVRRPDQYYPSLFDLILTIHRIPFVHPAISELRELLRHVA
jgi:WD40 repeat protein